MVLIMSGTEGSRGAKRESAMAELTAGIGRFPVKAGRRLGGIHVIGDAGENRRLSALLH